MNHISQPSKKGAKTSPKRIDHIKMLRARVFARLNSLLGEDLPANVPDKLLLSKMKAKIEDLKGSGRLDDAEEIRLRFLALESYDLIILEMSLRPEKDAEIKKVVPSGQLGGPMVELPHDSLSFDAERLRKVVAKADCDFDKPRNGAHLAGERSSIHVIDVPDKKKPAVD